MRARTSIPIIVVISGLCLHCGRSDAVIGPSAIPAEIAVPVPGASADSDTPPFDARALDTAPPEVFVGAGDIALCAPPGRHAETARLLDAIGGTVFALGDNAYQSGTRQEYNECYDRTWGRHRARTRPVPGNHEYETPGAWPYFDYFGASAGPRGLGYYSFDLGAWHIIALNSNVPVAAGSPQGMWLRADLAAHPSKCTLAYWHHPRFSSGKHGSYERMADFWRILHDAGADVVLSAHDHTYERFAPQDPYGAPDQARGIRQFVAGTGGANPYPFTTIRANSEVRISGLGVLKLTLRGGGYDWEFVSVSGPGDAGSGACH